MNITNPAELQAIIKGQREQLEILKDHYEARGATITILQRKLRDAMRKEPTDIHKTLCDIRDAVLHGRGPLEAVLDNDQTNAVLAVIDDHWVDSKEPAPPAERCAECERLLNDGVCEYCKSAYNDSGVEPCEHGVIDGRCPTCDLPDECRQPQPAAIDELTVLLDEQLSTHGGTVITQRQWQQLRDELARLRAELGDTACEVSKISRLNKLQSERMYQWQTIAEDKEQMLVINDGRIAQLQRERDEAVYILETIAKGPGMATDNWERDMMTMAKAQTERFAQ